MKKLSIEEALEQSQYVNDLPIVRVCMECNDFLDEKSEVIATRSKVERLISHGYCDSCTEKILEED